MIAWETKPVIQRPESELQVQGGETAYQPFPLGANKRPLRSEHAEPEASRISLANVEDEHSYAE